MEIKGNEDVLDLGCGVGHLTRKIRVMTEGIVVGIDPSEGMIREAMEKSRGDITFEVKSAEEMGYEDDYDVIFCNSVLQWFTDPQKAVENCYTALRKGGRIGVQAPAKRVYCPNFIEAVEKVKEDPRTRDIFTHFKEPWFLLETDEEYTKLFEEIGFEVGLSKIEHVKAKYTAKDVFNMFLSGAAVGYLNQDYYDIKIDTKYIDNFKKIVRDAFVQQTNNQKKVEVIFYRLFLVAFKK